MKYALRSGATWPYTTNSQVTYTCYSCYTGEGTITCQDNGQWKDTFKCTGIAIYYIQGKSFEKVKNIAGYQT